MVLQYVYPQEMLEKNLRIVLTKFKLSVDEETLIEQAKNCLPGRKYDPKATFGSSIECQLLCKKRKVRIKSEMIISCPTREYCRTEKVLAFRSSTLSQATVAACCRHHDENLELHCSYNRLLRDTHFGIPLLFLEVDKKPCAIIIYLHSDSDQTKVNTTKALDSKEVIVRCKVPNVDVIQLIVLDRLRSKCLMVQHDSDFYIFLCGERTFKHLQ
jgi:hypothetical protein